MAAPQQQGRPPLKFLPFGPSLGYAQVGVLCLEGQRGDNKRGGMQCVGGGVRAGEGGGVQCSAVFFFLGGGGTLLLVAAAAAWKEPMPPFSGNTHTHTHVHTHTHTHTHDVMECNVTTAGDLRARPHADQVGAAPRGAAHLPPSALRGVVRYIIPWGKNGG